MDQGFSVYGVEINWIKSQEAKILTFNGADTITTGGGADVHTYTTIVDSSSATVGSNDKVTDFAAGTDKLDVTNVPATIVAAASGSVAAVTFSADIEAGTANHAQVITANAGDLNGRSFIVSRYQWRRNVRCRHRTISWNNCLYWNYRYN